MLDKYLELIEKHPKRLVLIGLCLLYLLVQPSTYRTDRPRIEEQAQVNDPTDYVDDEPFDRTQCKVYYPGALWGANVF